MDTTVGGAGAGKRSATHREELLAAIGSRRAKLGIIGLGYVGLPLAMTAVKAGYPVLGFDINAARVAQINRGERVIKHIPPEMMAEATRSERFHATDNFDHLRKTDVIIICVPTPL